MKPGISYRVYHDVVSPMSSNFTIIHRKSILNPKSVLGKTTSNIFFFTFYNHIYNCMELLADLYFIGPGFFPTSPGFTFIMYLST